MKILSIDPVNIYSAYTILDEDLFPLKFGKIKNEEFLELIYSKEFKKCDYIAIEMVACYGMAVGATIFDTCVWIGRFTESLSKIYKKEVNFVYRRDVKLNLCKKVSANDSNVMTALVDRFAPNVRNHGKGIKSNQGWFYGFKADIWASYAVGVTFYDLNIEK